MIFASRPTGARSSTDDNGIGSPSGTGDRTSVPAGTMALPDTITTTSRPSREYRATFKPAPPTRPRTSEWQACSSCCGAVDHAPQRSLGGADGDQASSLSERRVVILQSAEDLVVLSNGLFLGVLLDDTAPDSRAHRPRGNAAQHRGQSGIAGGRGHHRVEGAVP